MTLRYTVASVLVLLILATAGWAAGRGGEGAEGDVVGSDTEHDRFIGLSLDEAAALAESENRIWRVARQDGTEFALTSDLSPGRVTFEVDEDIVTSAQIERPNTDAPGNDGTPEDPARANLLADAVVRIIGLDNSFGASDVFDDIRVARFVGSSQTPLEPLDLEIIAAALDGMRSVRFMDDANAEIQALLDQTPEGVAVVVVERLDLLDDRAEVELHMWCGSLCGVFLTYEATPSGDGWEIIGTTGPIAVS